MKSSHRIISVASCTTNCAANVAKVLNDSFGIKFAVLSTIHGYTSCQSLVDSSNERDPRRGRAAAVNIIPTTTGASKTIFKVLPELKKPLSVKKINDVFKKASKKEMKGIIEYSEENLVSSDILGNSHSAIRDSLMTRAEGNLVKIFAWYDNEYGYASRVVDVIKLLGKL